MATAFLRPDSRTVINLNIQGGADEQCANNRSGLLCSTCTLIWSQPVSW